MEGEPRELGSEFSEQEKGMLGVYKRKFARLGPRDQAAGEPTDAFPEIDLGKDEIGRAHV